MGAPPQALRRVGDAGAVRADRDAAGLRAVRRRRIASYQRSGTDHAGMRSADEVAGRRPRPRRAVRAGAGQQRQGRHRRRHADADPGEGHHRRPGHRHAGIRHAQPGQPQCCGVAAHPERRARSQPAVRRHLPAAAMVGNDPRPDDPADRGAEVLPGTAQGRRLATDGTHRRRAIGAALGVPRRLRRRRARGDPVLPSTPARGPGRGRPRRRSAGLDGQRRDRKPVRRFTSPRITLGVQPVQAAPRQGPRGAVAALHHPDQPRSLGGVPADQDDRRLPAGLDEVASARA